MPRNRPEASSKADLLWDIAFEDATSEETAGFVANLFVYQLSIDESTADDFELLTTEEVDLLRDYYSVELSDPLAYLLNDWLTVHNQSRSSDFQKPEGNERLAILWSFVGVYLRDHLPMVLYLLQTYSK